MSHKPDHYHQTNPPCELKSVVLGRQNSRKKSEAKTKNKLPSGSLSSATACSVSCIHDGCNEMEPANNVPGPKPPPSHYVCGSHARDYWRDSTGRLHKKSLSANVEFTRPNQSKQTKQ